MTSSSNPSEDRRLRRSEYATRALGLLFSSIADSSVLTHLVLADSQGVLHGHSGDETSCDILAAYVPLLFKAVDVETRGQIQATLDRSLSGDGPRRVSLRRFWVEGEAYFLCALGAPASMRGEAVSRALSGARRILAI